MSARLEIIKTHEYLFIDIYIYIYKIWQLSRAVLVMLARGRRLGSVDQDILQLLWSFVNTPQNRLFD